EHGSFGHLATFAAIKPAIGGSITAVMQGGLLLRRHSRSRGRRRAVSNGRASEELPGQRLRVQPVAGGQLAAVDSAEVNRLLLIVQLYLVKPGGINVHQPETGDAVYAVLS